MATENVPPATRASSSPPKEISCSNESSAGSTPSSPADAFFPAAEKKRGQAPPQQQRSSSNSNSSPPSLASLHSSAAALHRAGDLEGALEGYSAAIGAARRRGVVHRDFHVCLCNRALVLLRLFRPAEALQDAREALRMLRSGSGGGSSSSSLARTLAAEAAALNGLMKFEEALSCSDSGLTLFPGDARLSLEAEVAARGMREKKREGAAVSSSSLALSSSSPLSSPSPSLASLAADALVLRRHEHLCSAFHAAPSASLLTPKQASRDAKIRDAHSFAVVRCDEAAPARALSAVGDASRLSRLCAAVRSAVLTVAQEKGLEPSLLDIGGGIFSGALAAEGVVAAAEAMREGGEEEEEKGEAFPPSLPLPRGRAALVERWAYLADSTRDVLDANGFDASVVRVIHARAEQVRADGRVKGGVCGGVSSSSSPSASALSPLAPSSPFPSLPPICANVVVAAGLIDDGLLTGGIVPALRHALAELTVREEEEGEEEEAEEQREGGEGQRQPKKEAAPAPPPPSSSLLPLIVPRAAAVFACLAQISSCDPAFSSSRGEKKEKRRKEEGEEEEGEIFDRSALREALDARRWAPGGFSCGVPLAPGGWRRLSGDVKVLDLDFRALALSGGAGEEGEEEDDEEEGALDDDGETQPSSSSSSSTSTSPSCSSSSVFEVAATTRGVANAIVVWHELDLGDGGSPLSSGPCEDEEEEEVEGKGGGQRRQQQRRSSPPLQRHRHLHPAVHWLDGGLSVLPGTRLAFRARHNTARIEVKASLLLLEKEEEQKVEKSSPYLYRCLPDLAFPQSLFAAFRDIEKLRCYSRALKAAVACARERDGFANVLVEGGASSTSGGGGGGAAVALAAAAAGADSVVVTEPLPSTAAAARRLVANCGFSRVVTVLEGGGDRGEKEGREMINVLALDAFDAALLGGGAEALARGVASRRWSPSLAPRGLAAVVPARGTLWCAGVEAKCGAVGGRGGGSGGDEEEPAGGGDGEGPPLRATPPPLLSDLSALDRYRWRPSAETVDLETEQPGLRLLTTRARAWEGVFGLSEEEEDGGEEDEEGGGDEKKKKKETSARGGGGGLPLTLEARARGELTAVAFWFELDFGAGVRLSTEPSRWKEREEQEGSDDGGSGSETKSSPSSSSGFNRRRHHHQHHWGHSLQYLDRWCLLDPEGSSRNGGEAGGGGERKARLVARRPRGAWGGVRVALRRGATAAATRPPPAPFPPADTASAAAAAAAAAAPAPPSPSSSSSSSSRWAPRAPWLEEWGGGVSTENPHVQRSKYFDLVSADALQRACREGSMAEGLGGVAPRRADDWALAASLGNRSNILLSSSSSHSSSSALVARFAGRRPPPSIADDLSPLVAQAGSLGLDLAEIGGQARRWAIAEVLAKRSGGASGTVEVAAEAGALGTRPLWLC